VLLPAHWRIGFFRKYRLPLQNQQITSDERKPKGRADVGQIFSLPWVKGLLIAVSFRLDVDQFGLLRSFAGRLGKLPKIGSAPLNGSLTSRRNFFAVARRRLLASPVQTTAQDLLGYDDRIGG
jgi:hypothetical protein